MRVPKSETATNLVSAGILARLTAALNLKGEEEVQVSGDRKTRPGARPKSEYHKALPPN